MNRLGFVIWLELTCQANGNTLRLNTNKKRSSIVSKNSKIDFRNPRVNLTIDGILAVLVKMNATIRVFFRLLLSKYNFPNCFFIIYNEKGLHSIKITYSATNRDTSATSPGAYDDRYLKNCKTETKPR